jgi:hypothetical protein
LWWFDHIQRKPPIAPIYSDILSQSIKYKKRQKLTEIYMRWSNKKLFQIIKYIERACLDKEYLKCNDWHVKTMIYELQSNYWHIKTWNVIIATIIIISSSIFIIILFSLSLLSVSLSLLLSYWIFLYLRSLIFIILYNSGLSFIFNLPQFIWD